MSEVATDDFSDISSSEKLAIAIEAFGGNPTHYGTPVTWDRLPLECRAIGAAEWRKKRSKVGPKSGLTQEQLSWVAKQISDALDESLPDWVGSEVAALVPRIAEGLIHDAESRILKSLDSAISAAEASRVETRALRLELDQAQTNGFTAMGPSHESTDTREYLDERLNQVAANIRADVMERIGSVPHEDTIALRVAEAVEKRLAEIPKPEDGKAGRDALDLEIIESIERSKSYPAGTFALHDGGMVLALRDTDPIEFGLDEAGWKVTQDGVKSISSEQIDERTHALVVTRTSGQVARLPFVTSVANMDKGVHRPGMRYRNGDGVTKDMGFWIAQRDTDKTPPHKDWRLAIKGKWKP